MFKIPEDPQIVFNTIVKHLLTQNKQSVDLSGKCVYKNHEGLKCAAGCLIPDGDYGVYMEGKPWSYLVRRDYVPFGSLKVLGIISDLQLIHDGNAPCQWRTKLRELAELKGLDTSVLSEFE
jgi:hypothetical protein